MADVYAAVNGSRLSALRLSVPNKGPWIAECDFEEAPPSSFKAKLTIGALTLVGTIVARYDGTFALQRRVRIVGGAGMWGSPVQPKGYHNDAQIKARTVAEDAAREVGETLGSFVPGAERIGIDYARQAGTDGKPCPASRVLEDAAGGAAWWVDYAGVTNVGPRPATPLDASAYQVLEFDPRTKIATLAVDDPGAVVIGSTLTERLDAPQVVRELELTIDKGAMRISAWCGGSENGDGRLAGLFRTIVQRATDGQIFGKYRYRVVSMADDGRVNLQAVRKSGGLPDLLTISMWPGVAGAHAELASSAEVLVEFIEGDRTLPIVTHFAGKDGVGFVPTRLDFLGGGAAIALQGGLVQSGGAALVCTLTPVGLGGSGVPPNNAVPAGFPCFISFSLTPIVDVVAGTDCAPLYGAIATGSTKLGGPP